MPTPNSILLNHLPAIYHDSTDLRKLLEMFEAVLFQLSEEKEIQDVPLAYRISGIASLFDPHETPGEFLPWLADWVALGDREGLTEDRQRDLLAEIVPLYAKRGTKAYLQRLLEFFKPQNTTVVVDDQPLQGFTIASSKLGINTRLEPERPFWFKVIVTGIDPDIEPDDHPERRMRVEERIRRVVDLAKPAFTLYELHWGPVDEG